MDSSRGKRVSNLPPNPSQWQPERNGLAFRRRFEVPVADPLRPFEAYDRSPRFGGVRIGMGRLSAGAIAEPLAEMPDSDYVAEGFAWLHAHPDCIPTAAQRQVWGDCTIAAFKRWRGSGGQPYVEARGRASATGSSRSSRSARPPACRFGRNVGPTT